MEPLYYEKSSSTTEQVCRVVYVNHSAYHPLLEHRRIVLILFVVCVDLAGNFLLRFCVAAGMYLTAVGRCICNRHRSLYDTSSGVGALSSATDTGGIIYRCAFADIQVGPAPDVVRKPSPSSSSLRGSERTSELLGWTLCLEFALIDTGRAEVLHPTSFENILRDLDRGR